MDYPSEPCLVTDLYNSAAKRKRCHTSSPPSPNAGPSQDSQKNKRKKNLEIQIPAPTMAITNDRENHSANSLFSVSNSETGLPFCKVDEQGDIFISSDPTSIDNGFPALRGGPPIPGLFFDPGVAIPIDLEESLLSFCMQTYFNSAACNQVMLFGRFSPSSPSSSSSSSSSMSGLPDILVELLDHLSSLLNDVLPSDTYELLFPVQPTMARQAIINLYRPGEGITSHVDLLKRYADGVIGVSLGSGCVMRFDKIQTLAEDSEGKDSDGRWDVHLPERSVIVLSREARYGWKHGIEEKTRDRVLDSSGPFDGSHPLVSSAPGQAAWTWLERRVRMSVTYRWLLPGADLVGDTS